MAQRIKVPGRISLEFPIVPNLGMILARFGYNSGIIIYVRPLIEYCPNGLNSNEVKTTMRTRTIAGILIVALVAVSAGVVAAQHGQGGGAGGARYVDDNGDGVCDNIGERPEFVDDDNDGVCDNNCRRGRGGCGCGCGGNGANFVDEDGDGICDNDGINGRDDDNDGIPNGQDEDYEPPRDGRGRGNGGQGHGRNR